jgi:hypothetical protein
MRLNAFDAARDCGRAKRATLRGCERGNRKPIDRYAILEHDPEKWMPVFGKDHAPPKG